VAVSSTLHKLATVCCAALLAVACSSGYRGYGEFTDNGAGAAMERYMVDFGKVDLGKPNQKAFRMAGLPHVEFSMGLRPVNVSASCNETALSKVNIELQVQSEDGAVVIAEDAPLGSWVSGAQLVYRRGAERQQVGAAESTRTDVHAAQGWGTYFTPDSSATYLAKFYVRDTIGTQGCESRLVLLSGGWK